MEEDDVSSQNPKKRTRLQMMSDSVAQSGRDVPVGKVDVLQQTMRILKARVHTLNEANRQAESLRQQLELDLQLAEGGNTTLKEAQAQNEREIKEWVEKASWTALDVYECQIEHANELIHRVIANAFHKKIALLPEIEAKLALGSLNVDEQAAPETFQRKLADFLQDETREIIDSANEALTRTERQLTLVFNSDMYKRLGVDVRGVLNQRYGDLYGQATRKAEDVVKTLGDVVYKRFQVFTNRFIEGGLEMISDTGGGHDRTEDVLKFINWTLSINITEGDESFVYSLEEGYFYGLLFARVKVPGNADQEQKLMRVSNTIKKFLFQNDSDSDSGDEPSKRTRMDDPAKAPDGSDNASGMD